MVKEKKSKKKIVIIGSVIALIVVFFIVAIVYSKNGSGSESKKIVKADEIQIESIESTIFTNGVVVPSESRNIISELAGEVKSINAEVGDWVNEGDTLATLDTTELERNLETSKINLEIAKINLRDLKNSGKSQFDLALKSSEMNLANAEKSMNDKKLLLDSGSISKSEYDAAVTAYNLAKNDYTQTKRNYDGVGKEAQIEVSKLQLKSSELAIKTLEDQIASSIIKAPISGMVTASNLKSGEMVSMGMTSFTIEDTKSLIVKTQISEYDISQVSLGQSVKIVNEGSLKEYEGKVSYIAPSAQKISNGQSTETIIEVEIEITNKDTDFKPNYSANVEINTAKEENAMVVPYEAIFTNKDGEKIVFLVGEDERAKQVNIKTGIEGDLVVQLISDEIKEGDKIIVNPSEDLKDGDLLKVSEVK